MTLDFEGILVNKFCQFQKILLINLISANSQTLDVYFSKKVHSFTLSNHIYFEVLDMT